MTTRRLMTSLAALLALVVGLIGDPVIHASPQPTPAGSAQEQRKVTLDDTSIDGPTLWTNNPAQGAQAGSPAAVLGWTGTDSNHSLNVLVGPYSSSPQKLTLWTENSFTSPALAFQDGRLLLS